MAGLGGSFAAAVHTGEAWADRRIALVNPRTATA
jgi:hypothetical protein